MFSIFWYVDSGSICLKSRKKGLNIKYIRKTDAKIEKTKIKKWQQNIDNSNTADSCKKKIKQRGENI